MLSRVQVLQHYFQYCEQQLAKGTRLNHLSRHVVGLFHGEPNSRLWRQHISENAYLKDAGLEVLQRALEKQQQANQYQGLELTQT